MPVVILSGLGHTSALTRQIVALALLLTRQDGDGDFLKRSTAMDVTLHLRRGETVGSGRIWV